GLASRHGAHGHQNLILLHYNNVLLAAGARCMRESQVELWRSKQVRVRRGRWNSFSATVATAWLIVSSLPALAQDNVVATATLPRDLSPWGMYLNADTVVKAVLIILVVASVVTWTVWLGNSVDTFYADLGLAA